MAVDFERLGSELVEPIKKSVTTLPPDTLAAIKNARDREGGGGKVQLEAMLEAIEIGEDQGIPICQDTGTPTFYISVGSSFPAIHELDKIEPALKEAVRKATEEVPIRPNTVHPLTGKNPGDNTGNHIPHIEWSITEGDQFRMTYLPKGGGCTNMSQLTMMTPGRGLKGVKEIVLERIASMEGKPCPPTVVGVGIGGSASICLQLAKKALLRPVGTLHEEPQVADLEKELMEKANRLGVGPMGVGGDVSVLDVKVEYEYRHPASFPVGITPQCWANRRVSMAVKPDGTVEVDR